jgi:hypothetical protein
VNNCGTGLRTVRFGIGYELQDDPYVVGGWTEKDGGVRVYSGRWLGHRPSSGSVFVIPFEGSLVAETELASGESSTRSWVIVLDDTLSTNAVDVAEVKKLGWNGLLREHLRGWDEYYGKAWIRVPDEDVQKMLDTARYTIRCAVTEWSYPPGLFPGHWQSRYFGFDETYVHSALLAMNEIGLARRCPDFRHRLLPVAEGRMGGDGQFGARWTWETLEDGLVEGAPQGMWLDHVFHMGTIARTAWMQYTYSGDRKYLEDCGFPILRGCARFFSKNMVYRDSKGNMYIGKCTDFERLGPGAEKPFMTTVGAVYALRCAADAASIIGAEGEEANGWRNIADALVRGLPVRDGHYVACINKPDVPNIGLVGGFYPFSVFRASDQTAKASAEYFFANASSVGSMYPSGKGVCSWYAGKMAMTLLALGERDAPVKWLTAAAKQSIGPFGETYEMREPERKYQTAPWFTTAAGACIEAAARLFVYDEDGVTYLLRGVPKEWQDGSVLTSAAGGFRIRLDLSQGELTRIEVAALYPEKGKSIRLRGRKGLFSGLVMESSADRLETGERMDDLVVRIEDRGARVLSRTFNPSMDSSKNKVVR